jgi:hypothetical protein
MLDFPHLGDQISGRDNLGVRVAFGNHQLFEDLLGASLINPLGF